MGEIFENDGLYLEHHGIKGQAWGVRNGPPYPLGSVGKAAFSKVKKILSNEVRSNRSKQISAKKFNAKLVNAKSTNNTADANYIKTKTKKQEAENEYQRARHRGKMDREAEKLEQERMTTERARLQGERLKEYQNTIKSLNPNIKGPTEAFKQRIINSGDKKLLKKYGHLLNNEEYEAAMNRLTLQKEIKKGKLNENHRKFNESLQNVRDTVDIGVDLYNRGAGAYNAFVPEEQRLKQISKEISKPKSKQEILNERAAEVKTQKINNIMSKINAGTATDAERETLNSILGVQGGKKKTEVDIYNETSAKAKNDLINELLEKANQKTAYERQSDFIGPQRATADTMSNLTDEERAALFSILGIKNWKNSSSGGSS